MVTPDGPDAAESPVEAVVGVGASQRVGSFRFYYDDQRWEWSDEVAKIHGYEPGTVVPTTELLLEHKHPDDRDRVGAAITKARATGLPFSSRHRIIDTAGRVHYVIVVGDQLSDETGQVVGTTGFYIDITESRIYDLNGSLDEVVEEFEARRALIEQAKGALMFVYGINADRAFDVLRWRSQTTNIKVSRLAEQILADISAVPVPDQLRRRVDHLLLTAHERA